jgi:hypothetical protein
MNIERPTNRCSVWFASSVRLMRAVVESGNVAICNAEAREAGANADDVLASACGRALPHSTVVNPTLRTSARYIFFKEQFLDIDIFHSHLKLLTTCLSPKIVSTSYWLGSEDRYFLEDFKAPGGAVDVTARAARPIDGLSVFTRSAPFLSTK